MLENIVESCVFVPDSTFINVLPNEHDTGYIVKNEDNNDENPRA